MADEHPSDRRRSPRYNVRAPILVEGALPGVTTDISSGGVAFECNQPLERGESVMFELSLVRSGVLLLCAGQVLRVEERDGVKIVAATIDTIRFEGPQESEIRSALGG
ncbi:MAG TPA: PilZ domain-containing protein [Thermoanaerobaculia bacterium]|nr:PilZ domain-containing protein [Thermoanaerobaculia bacterium]